MYGTTTGGTGHIFQVSLSGTFATLHNFNGSDGSDPYAGLLQAIDGSFYGATLKGGANGVGTIFRMDSSNALTTLYNFPTEGLYPRRA